MIRCECGEVDNLEVVKFCDKCGTSYTTRQDTINLVKEKLKISISCISFLIRSSACCLAVCNSPGDKFVPKYFLIFFTSPSR